MQLKTLLASSAQKLSSAGIDNPQLEAELLAAGVLKTNRADVISRYSSEFEQVSEFNAVLARRLNREPLQYILGEASFYGLTFILNKNVLIPRPESELLVEEALKYLRKLPPHKESIVVDVGTGSGALAVAIAANHEKCHVYTIDVSLDAIAVAKQNASRHKVADRITFLYGDLITPLVAQPELIVANLPYVKTSTLSTLQPELRFEPESALDGGMDGLDLIRRLWLQLKARFEGSGIPLMLEHEADQADAIQKMVHKPVRDVKDLAGLHRISIILL